VRFIEFIEAALTIAKCELKKRKKKGKKKTKKNVFSELIPRWHPLQIDGNRKILSNRFQNFINLPGSSRICNSSAKLA